MMAPYYPITVHRSDGVLSVATKSGVNEPNEPTAAQQNDTPDSKGNVDCYKRLDPEEPKAIDWRRKLGGMLIHRLGGKEQANKQYILKQIPDGYVLWEHLKYNVDKVNGTREKGKHAGGTFERQDAYLYGHPQGRKKRFRKGDDDTAEEQAKAEPVVKKDIKPIPASAPPARGKVCCPVQAAAAKPSAPPMQARNSFQSTSGEAKVSAEQRMDGDANGKYLYRSGELHQPHQIKDDEGSIRPWLAWSVPNTTIPAIQNLTYDDVPWDRVVRGELDGGQPRDYVVDGSILAAKVIDSSYSLYDRIEGALAGPGEIHYRGMFLGAEKIWVGEPVRIRVPGNDIIVLIIQKLIERTASPNTSIVTFVGDVYKFVDMPTPYKSRAEWPTPKLPARMVSDLRFRNEVADSAKTGQWYEWSLLEPMARKGLSDIKGRWYETRTLLPILRGAQKFQEEVAKGLTSDAGAWMNGRRDKNNNPETRKKNRRDTLGRAVPADFKVSRGLDGNPADDVFPDVQQPQLEPPISYVESDLDQYMDLDQAGANHDFYGATL
ncbi:hypothetical protein M7I_3896 [Glarea lozoyensis 74030]|uniref:Cryptic loci regulator 2 C-terminal domain-containing protein n=1 Tax=Glarea lozoyensis (strain ATCC 74030 / MF5533) TaxID=1104152 RepID=H0EMQ5_GLAL7|nr:hypothetical protein M7I_3896 [Glarea lozoyensis 74030]